MKACRACGLLLPSTAFHRCKTGAQGLQAYCRQCNRAKRQEWVVKNLEKVRAKDRARERDPHERRARYKAWIAANSDRSRMVAKAWRVANAAGIKERFANWRAKNPGKVIANCAARKARKRHAMPPCLTAEDVAYIQTIYECAAVLGKHVDHYVPLRHPLVCGLHVPWNLQMLTPAENLAKSNRFSVG